MSLRQFLQVLPKVGGLVIGGSAGYMAGDKLVDLSNAPIQAKIDGLKEENRRGAKALVSTGLSKEAKAKISEEMVGSTDDAALVSKGLGISRFYDIKLKTSTTGVGAFAGYVAGTKASQKFSD